MTEFQLFNWDWVRVVAVWSTIFLAISTAILVPLLNYITPRVFERPPVWLRWILVLPSAFLLATVAEMLPRFFFSLYEILINHTLTFKPGFDSLVWAAYAPLFFVIGGVKMAPSHRFATFVALGGFKLSVTMYNIYSILDFTKNGSDWSRRDLITFSPFWWNVPVYLLGICLLLGYGVFTLKASARRQALTLL